MLNRAATSDGEPSDYEFIDDKPAIDLLFGSDRERLASRRVLSAVRYRRGVDGGGSSVRRIDDDHFCFIDRRWGDGPSTDRGSEPGVRRPGHA